MIQQVPIQAASEPQVLECSWSTDPFPLPTMARMSTLLMQLSAAGLSAADAMASARAAMLFFEKAASRGI